MGLAKQRLELQKEIHKLRRENDEAEKKDNEFYSDLDDELRATYGLFASKIFKDFNEEDIEEADSTDLTIAPRLGEIYRLATTGCKQKEIDKLVAQIVKDSFR